MTIAYIALGSNLASPLEQVNAALKLSPTFPIAVSSRFLRFTARRRLAHRISPIT